MADSSRQRHAFFPTRFFRSALCLLLCLVCSPAVFADADKYEQLQQLRRQIDGVKKEVAKLRGKRDSAQAELERTETAIGKVAAAIRELDRKVVTSRQAVAGLEAEKRQLNRRLDDMRDVIAATLRTAYANGRQEQVKLLLNQQDPATIGRMMVYHGYFTRARSERMHEVRELIVQLDAVDAKLQAELTAVEQLRSEKHQQAERLGDEQQKRKVIVAKIEAGLKDRTGELERLRQNEKQLQKLVEELQKTLRDIPPASGSYTSLKSLKGKLGWPVAGRITSRYGERTASGKLRSRGVTISTLEGSDVQAIARGRVAFADWLRGFGLLLIIDHGKGYMSLYGQNRSLYREVGEWVEAGDVVAAAGNSGGLQQAGLYLELRKDGRPFNPKGWFAGKPASLKAGR